MSRKKCKKACVNYHLKDTHHICYQARHWKNGYAKLLREHWYMKVEIPQMTLHRLIHSKIHDIPCPEGKDCKRAYLELIRREEEGLLSEYDRVEDRIDFLIEMWKETCPATTAILQWQRDIVAKFFGGG